MLGHRFSEQVIHHNILGEFLVATLGRGIGHLTKIVLTFVNVHDLVLEKASMGIRKGVIRLIYVVCQVSKSLSRFNPYYDTLRVGAAYNCRPP